MPFREYLQAHPDCGEFTQISQFPAPIPTQPLSISQRRQDVFTGYRGWIQVHRDAVPIDIYTARLRNVTLVTADHGRRASALRTAEGTFFPELFAQAQTAERLFDSLPSSTPSLKGPAAIATEISSGDNYYHWLLTALPKVLLLMYRHARLKFQHIIVNHAATPFGRQTLELLGIPPEIVISATDYPFLQLDDAYVASLRSELLYPHALLPEMFRAVFPRLLYRGHRLFIIRKDSRTITNQAQLIDILQPLGFQSVQLETLSMSDQIRLFAQAQCVIAPHGAGLSNLIFSPARTKVLELFSPQQVSATYWYLANACSHEYHFLIGQGEDLPYESDNWRSAERPDITIDPGEFAKAVRALNLLA